MNFESRSVAEQQVSAPVVMITITEQQSGRGLLMELAYDFKVTLPLPASGVRTWRPKPHQSRIAWVRRPWTE